MNSKALLLTLLLLAAIAALFFRLPGDGVPSASGNIREKNRELVPSVSSASPASSGVHDQPSLSTQSRIEARLVQKRQKDSETLAVRNRLLEMQRRDDEGLVVETMADGHQSIDLKGRFQHVTRLVAAADGSLVPMCGSFLPDQERGVTGE